MVVDEVARRYGVEHWKKHDGALQGILVERSDLSQSAIDQLSSIVSEALAIKLAERGYQLAGKIPDHIARDASAAFARAVHERDRNRSPPSVDALRSSGEEIILTASTSIG